MYENCRSDTTAKIPERGERTNKGVEEKVLKSNFRIGCIEDSDNEFVLDSCASEIASSLSKPEWLRNISC